jgi:hypothetical protein
MRAYRVNYTRKYKRYPTQREAHFYLEDISGSRQVCTIVNISRKGMGLIFHTDVDMNIGDPIRVEVAVPGSAETMSVSGNLRWFDKMEIDIIGGIELVQELNEEEVSRLDSSRG